MATSHAAVSGRSAGPVRRAAVVLIAAAGIVLSPLHAKASDAGSTPGTAGPSAVPTRAEKTAAAGHLGRQAGGMTRTGEPARKAATSSTASR
jgi:hypothetical protein